MRILVIPGYYGFGGRSASGSGRAGVFFRDQAIALARAGHDTSLMYVYFDVNRGVDVEIVDDNGVRCIYIHAAPWPRINSIYRMLLMVWAFRTVFIQDRPQVVHAHVFHALPGAWAISRAFGIPCVVTEHSSKVRQGSLNAIWRAVARIGYSRACAVVAVSGPLAQALGRYASRQVTVIPNLVRDEFFDVPLRVRSSDEPITFLSIGYCDRIKGWDILLRSFARLDAERLPSLVLCGGICSELTELANTLGISDRVRVIGQVSPEDIPSLIAASDCHVMPSRVETFGIASIEALACGKPIIMTETDAASTIVQTENGMVVPTEDVAALADAMQIVIDRVGNYDPEAIRRACRERFSGKSVTSQLTAIYQRCLADEGVASKSTGDVAD